MDIRKEISEHNELYVWMNGKLIYTRWIDQGYSKVFDKIAYGKDTFVSIIEDEKGRIRKRKNIFINGYSCKSQGDFWNQYVNQIPSDSAKFFGRNLDAFNDAITGGGPGFPGDCIIEIVGTEDLEELFGKRNFEYIISLLEEAKFVDLILERNTHDDT